MKPQFYNVSWRNTQKHLETENKTLYFHVREYIYVFFDFYHKVLHFGFLVLFFG